MATGAVIGAGVTDTYTVSVNAAVGQSAWDGKTTVCSPDKTSNGGFLNAATLTVGGDTTTVADCAPPETLTFDKSMSGDPVWDAATGRWVVTYAVTVTNSSAKAQFYNLADATNYASGITVVSSSATKNVHPDPRVDVGPAVGDGCCHCCRYARGAGAGCFPGFGDCQCFGDHQGFRVGVCRVREAGCRWHLGDHVHGDREEHGHRGWCVRPG